jgi:hypothetical protein
MIGYGLADGLVKWWSCLGIRTSQQAQSLLVMNTTVSEKDQPFCTFVGTTWYVCMSEITKKSILAHNSH